MQKAFLKIDGDYDGFITVEDLLKVLGNSGDYADLQKLVMDKDSTKKGKIGYSDFSKWLGGVIQMSEGFVFRHDSTKNPLYELQQEKDTRTKGNDREMAAKCLLDMTLPDLEKLILEKMKTQWKTIRRAFGSLNMEKTGSISKGELGYFLDFWGIHISQENFDKIYSRFDLDGDGVISYKDF